MKTILISLASVCCSTMSAQDTISASEQRIHLDSLSRGSNQILFHTDSQNTVDIKPAIDNATWPFRRKSERDDRIDSVKIFSLSPMSRRVSLVNGFVLGFGHYENARINRQKINGLNIEASPLSLALVSWSINIPFEGLFVGIKDYSISNAAFLYDKNPTVLTINGLNISSGGFTAGTDVNGMNVCVLSKINEMNGLSLTGAVLSAERFNGLSIAGIANLAEFGNGVQIGISNVSRRHNGVQIGLFNHSKNLRGVQFGLWNTNAARKLPFINWQFKKK